MFQLFSPVARIVLSVLACAFGLMGVAGVASAACLRNDPDQVVFYDGAIGEGERYRIRMQLVFEGEQVKGLYFYASQLRDIALRGVVSQGRDITLDEVDAQGQVTARFEGRFSDSDPHGRFSGQDLGCTIIVGAWKKTGATSSLPLYLASDSQAYATLGRLYENAGAQDDEIVNRNAYLFWSAVKQGDRNRVAAQMAYPVRVNGLPELKRVRNASELLASYDRIFTAPYRAAITHAIPRAMFSRDQGIMLGGGEVWFGPDGKVIALNLP